MAAAADALMEGIIDHEIMLSPWYIATDVWVAIRLDGRAALPADGPLIAVKSEWRVLHDDEALQTKIELRDATTQTVLGRAKLRYCTRPIDDRSGPTLWSFRVFAGAATDAKLIAAALLADQAHPSTKTALTDAAARSCEETNLLAARVLLWCGLVAVCNSHVDKTMPYHFPLRASPDLVRKHGPFLAWRGMKMSRGRNCAPTVHQLLSGGPGGWPYLKLGDEDGMMGSDDSADDSDDEGSVVDFTDEKAMIEAGAKFMAKDGQRKAAKEEARAKVAQRLLSTTFDPDREDSDSEHELDQGELGTSSSQYQQNSTS